jgi:hypothetical protein
MTERKIIRCHVCQADPTGRWKKPPAMIWIDGDEYVCRDHVSPKKEKEIRERESVRSLGEGALR